MRKFSKLAAVLTVILSSASLAETPSNVKLFYGPHEPGLVFACDVEVEKSVPGTFLEVCGFDRGFAGMWEKADSSRGVVLKIWDVDGGRDNPDKVKEKKRALVTESCKGAKSFRFGKEGSGSVIFFPFKWKLNEKYSFTLKASVDTKETIFTGWFSSVAESKWQKIGSIKVANYGIEHLRGYYSSINASIEQPVNSSARKASFSTPWIRQSSGSWMQFITGDFTADPPKPNINAGSTSDDKLYLETGGKTVRKAEIMESFSIAERPSPPDKIKQLFKTTEEKASTK